MNEKMRELLSKWSDYILTDDVCMDEFLFEGMTFNEGLELMDHISKAVKSYITAPAPSA